MTAPPSHAESARQWVHIGSGLFALLLRGLTGWQASAMAAAALAFNLLLLPRLGGTRLYRPVDHERGFPLGILLYPLSVLLLTLAFHTRLDIAAAAWGILAFGDGFATLVGRSRTEKTAENAKHAEKKDLSAIFAISTVFSGRIPWNPDKSVAGTMAFIVFGSIAGVALAWWVRPGVVPVPPLAFAAACSVLSAEVVDVAMAPLALVTARSRPA